MEIQPAELIDKTSIVKLKIERVGEPHLKLEYEECEKAIEELKRKGVKIREKWIEELYDINGKIWDLDFKIRDYVNSEIEDISKEEFFKIGKEALQIMELMKQRVSTKNKITNELNIGFKEIKIDHASA